MLAVGLTYHEIGERLEPPRSEDYVTAKVSAIRRAMVANALAHADEMEAELRAHLEALHHIALEREAASAAAAAAKRRRFLAARKATAAT